MNGDHWLGNRIWEISAGLRLGRVADHRLVGRPACGDWHFGLAADGSGGCFVDRNHRRLPHVMVEVPYKETIRGFFALNQPLANGNQSNLLDLGRKGNVEWGLPRSMEAKGNPTWEAGSW